MFTHIGIQFNFVDIKFLAGDALKIHDHPPKFILIQMVSIWYLLLGVLKRHFKVILVQLVNEKLWNHKIENKISQRTSDDQVQNK